MHWESGLSLIPTALILLFALLVWTHQAARGTALFEVPPPLPDFPNNGKLSRSRAAYIASIGRAFPRFRDAGWLRLLWLAAVSAIFVLLFQFHPFKEITTLEGDVWTRRAQLLAGTVTTLMLFDTLFSGT